MVELGNSRRETALALAQARRLYEERRRRDASFPCDLFGEPAWDLLLDLYVARGQDRPVSILSGSVAAGVPVAETVKLVAKLEGQGLVEIYSGTEPTRSLIALTDAAFERMTALLSEFQ